MKALILALAIVFAPVSANAFCFKEVGGLFHKSQVQVEPAAPTQVAPVPFRGSTATPSKPMTFCQQVWRNAGMSLAVGFIVGTAKAAVFVFTGVPIL